MFYLQNRLKSMLPSLGVLLVLLSFGVMTGLAPVLHAHELDFNSPHDDCAPCHWSQSKEVDESDSGPVASASRYRFFKSTLAESLDNQSIHKLFNRGPPSLS